MKKRLCFVMLCICMLFNNGIGQRKHTGKPNHDGKTGGKKPDSDVQYGTASFYANKFIGRKTASGKRFSQMKLTAAHNHVPLGTWLRVTNMLNKRTVLVKVIDRLHSKNRRIIDLSGSAATALGSSATGLLKVMVQSFGTSRPYAGR